MTVEFSPSVLHGLIAIPPSKSLMHRSILCAALADGTSTIHNIIYSQDIEATLSAVQAMGAQVKRGDQQVCITGTRQVPAHVQLNCCESGSTLRFLIPICAALGMNATFKGHGKLPSRPITPYLTALGQNGTVFDYKHTMPFAVSGQLTGGVFEMAGDISSQFITGLLFALPLLKGNSEIRIVGKLESKPYVDMTLAVLNCFGIHAEYRCNSYFVQGNQRYQPFDYTVESDFSQAAFFAVAGGNGSNLVLKGLNPQSAQGDKEILTIIQQTGAQVIKSEQGVEISGRAHKPFRVDVSDIPDLVPILAVLASFCKGRSHIIGAKRLKIKESDRLTAIAACLNQMGGNVVAFADRLEITGVDGFHSALVDSFNDHRIAMSVAIAALSSDGPVKLTTAQSVQKSYPDFYKDYNQLGGNAIVIDME